MTKQQYTIHMRVVAPLPPYYCIAYALWGEGVDFDSDGDSNDPESTTWRELTIILRPDYKERLDIDPLKDDRNLLVMKATSNELLVSAYNFLRSRNSVVRVDA